jgi:hypothetical protein
MGSERTLSFHELQFLPLKCRWGVPILGLPCGVEIVYVMMEKILEEDKMPASSPSLPSPAN